MSANYPYDINGLILLYKERGLTSHDCVNKMRKLTGIKKIGHLGTLDPEAEGILPVCIGAATRIIEYLDKEDKVYKFALTFGLTSDTYDIWGRITELDKKEQASANLALSELDFEKIERALDDFRGAILQKPPIYSAIRKDGKRLYQYAREGKEPEIGLRKVEIHELELLSYEPETKTAFFRVSCSKGTYVRSLCHDIGKKLGPGGLMSYLLRESFGDFSISQSVKLLSLESREDLDSYLIKMHKLLDKLGEIEGVPGDIEDISMGRPVFIKEGYIKREPLVAEIDAEKNRSSYCFVVDDELLALGTLSKGSFHPQKVLIKKKDE